MVGVVFVPKEGFCMHDVIIVGSGPAGGTLASLLEGLDVLVLEKEKNAVLKDSGLVSSHFTKFVEDESLIEAEVTRMEAVSPSGKTFWLQSNEPFAYILKRKRFSYYLRIEAKKNADMKYERARGFARTSGGVAVETSKGMHEAKMVIGCDGTLSDIRKSMGIEKPPMVPGIFSRTKNRLQADEIKVFLNKFYSPDFFSWIIPQVNEYGLMTSVRPRENFEYFKKSIGAPDGELHSYMIPMGTTKSYSERALLVGEACGQTKPLTGGGIIFGMRAAHMAASVVKQAIEKNDFSSGFLSRYEKSWKSEVSWEIKKQLFLRKAYRKMSNRDIDGLFRSFGSDIESVNTFDYDKITRSWKNLPKLKAVNFILKNAHLFI
ncbi:MAG: NAD(P)/FAD-dependent oxidoreductase [Candidatus Aenigmarchaeota archaeon]|nr:NAD(P)/FAD-dependent oxidoreductase [Candidatus Aenigmarchaeota archaeon]